MVKLADTQDLGSCGKPWGFESLHPHQKKRQQNAVVFYFKGLEVAPQPKMLCILPPLVGCTLEQVLAVSESLHPHQP